MARKSSSKKEKPPHLVLFGQRLKEAREASGHTQGELAKAAGVQQSDVSKLEGGLQGLSTERLLGLLTAARKLGIRVDYALTGHGPMIISTEEPALMAELREVIERHSK